MKYFQAIVYSSLLMAVCSSGRAADCTSASTGFAGGMPVHQTTDVAAIIFKGQLTIDADGAPDAYCPPPLKGRDYLENAGSPGNWYGVVTGPDGKPVTQGPTDPSPGCNVSATSLMDATKGKYDPAAYVDSATVPYVALPGGTVGNKFKQDHKISLGDVLVVYNVKSGIYASAIYADIAPATSKGEGSIRLADMLGIPSSPKNGGLSSRELVFVIFPQSGNGKPLSAASIEDIGNSSLTQWGGPDRLTACAVSAE